MSNISLDAEDRLYQEEVAAVKKWWSDSRWRYTKRPFTAEAIVQKRGTLKIDYPGNNQSKKLWQIVEQRWAVSTRIVGVEGSIANQCTGQRGQLHVWMSGPGHGHANG